MNYAVLCKNVRRCKRMYTIMSQPQHTSSMIYITSRVKISHHLIYYLHWVSAGLLFIAFEFYWVSLFGVFPS